MAKGKTFGIQPLGDRVVVKPSEKEGEKKLASGIIIPATADKEKPMTGTVVAVGRGKFEDGTLVPLQVKTGDTVLFGKYSHEEVKLDGETYYILSESSILGIVN